MVSSSRIALVTILQFESKLGVSIHGCVAFTYNANPLVVIFYENVCITNRIINKITTFDVMNQTILVHSFVSVDVY
jgi:hypothetical protein